MNLKQDALPGVSEQRIGETPNQSLLASREIINLRPEVLWFAREMERQLRKHDEAKGRWGWKSLTFLELYQLLDDEREELSNAFMGAHGSLEEMIHESAGLANIAMMIADNASDRLKKSATSDIGEGDAQYLSLAREVRDEVHAFLEQLDAGGTLECLINCDDYNDELLTMHLRFAEKYLHRAAVRMESAVKRLEEILRLGEPIPYEPTDKQPE